jgi:predicted RNase H-like HicB family nuclease
MTYTVVLVREEDGGYCVHVPALKGCHTQGDSLPEALDMVREAILAYMDGERELGKAMPPDATKFTLDVGDAAEALVLKVSVPVEEEAPVA